MFSIPLLPLALYRGRWQLRNGALEVSAPALAWFLRGPWFRALTGGSGFAAATIGHVIVARDASALDQCRVHEHVHVRQCERWGALFPLAYIAQGLRAAWTALCIDAYYHDNPFEIEARKAETEHPAGRNSAHTQSAHQAHS